MLKLYNTLTRKIEEFKPLNPPVVTMYTCGPTVYRHIHIGNFRTYLMADFLRRTLEYNAYKVTHIKNVTDVGHMRTSELHQGKNIDPVLEEALKEGKTPKEITSYYTKLFLEDEEKLNIKKANKYPKATEHIKEMIEIIKILLDKGLAYRTGGTVYFDVSKFKDYGQLSGNTLDKMDMLLKAVRISVETDKKDSPDFALWKEAEEDRMMKWESPWGEGFPGWHIECSAMSIKYLGDTFDIHTGGEDLIFPHHEDEIAQSEGASGKKFVNYWLHGGYLLIDGKKMSRSKGNVYTISDLQKKGFDPLAFRYLTMLTHYKQEMNFTWDALEAAQIAYKRLVEEVAEFKNPKIGCAEYEEKFLEAVNDNLNMPKALAVMWDLVKSDYPDSAKAESIFKMDQVLGLDLEKAREKKKNIKVVVSDAIKKLIGERERLRKMGSFTKADHLRNKIKKLGYRLKDTKEGVEIEKI
ncbi:MAG: cysteine--tRNA ligase [Candidatus Levybacteria bacterium]|nr:cysteine--tRNA ligase [Candidatus Levybacteria bacterium]